MRHRKHNHLLGVKAQHRKALISNLCAALIKHGRIETTLAKAKAIRPAIEKMITRAKKAKASDDPQVRLHHRRQCTRHLRDKDAVHILFNEKVDEFTNRPGGYVRIYKLGNVRLGDSAEMAKLELIRGDDEGYQKRRKKKSVKTKAEPSTDKKDSADLSSQELAANEPQLEEVLEDDELEDTDAVESENLDEFAESDGGQLPGEQAGEEEGNDPADTTAQEEEGEPSEQPEEEEIEDEDTDAVESENLDEVAESDGGQLSGEEASEEEGNDPADATAQEEEGEPSEQPEEGEIDSSSTGEEDPEEEVDEQKVETEDEEKVP